MTDRSKPHPVTSPTQTWMFWAGMVCGFAGVLLLSIGLYAYRFNHRFATGPVIKISATVDQLVDDHEGGHPYRIFFHYPLVHDSFSTKQSATEQTGDALHVGGPLPIKYLADSPTDCRIDLPAEDAWNGRTGVGAMIVGIMLGCACPYFLWQHRVSLKEATT